MQKRGALGLESLVAVLGDSLGFNLGTQGFSATQHGRRGDNGQGVGSLPTACAPVLCLVAAARGLGPRAAPAASLRTFWKVAFSPFVLLHLSVFPTAL